MVLSLNICGTPQTGSRGLKILRPQPVKRLLFLVLHLPIVGHCLNTNNNYLICLFVHSLNRQLKTDKWI